MKGDGFIVTGGSGLLGSHLRKELPGACFPTSEEFNVKCYESMRSWLLRREGTVYTILHCAALTSPPRVEAEPMAAIEINIVGTANIVYICHEFNLKLIYISTDYVFDGSKGNYKEDDPVMPVNKYSWSKLGGECIVRMYDNSLIVRLSFGPDVFPYQNAFTDQWTSRLPVSKIVPQILSLLIRDHEVPITGVIHLGGERRTVFEYAKELNPTVGKVSIKDVSFKVPIDTSLDTSKYKEIIKGT